MRQNTADLFINLALLIGGIFLLVLISDYPDTASRFPQLILIALVLLIGLDILNKIKAKIWKKTSEQGDGREIPKGNKDHRRAFYMVGLMCVFQGLVLVFGFTVGTLIFLIFSSWRWSMDFDCNRFFHYFIKTSIHNSPISSSKLIIIFYCKPC